MKKILLLISTLCLSGTLIAAPFCPSIRNQCQHCMYMHDFGTQLAGFKQSMNYIPKEKLQAYKTHIAKTLRKCQSQSTCSSTEIAAFKQCAMNTPKQAVDANMAFNTKMYSDFCSTVPMPCRNCGYGKVFNHLPTDTVSQFFQNKKSDFATGFSKGLQQYCSALCSKTDINTFTQCFTQNKATGMKAHSAYLDASLENTIKSNARNKTNMLAAGIKKMAEDCAKKNGLHKTPHTCIVKYHECFKPTPIEMQQLQVAANKVPHPTLSNKLSDTAFKAKLLAFMKARIAATKPVQTAIAKRAATCAQISCSQTDITRITNTRRCMMKTGPDAIVNTLH